MKDTRKSSLFDIQDSADRPDAVPRGAGSNIALRWCVYAVFFLSGTAALAYEISWSRQIGLLFGHTATAAATVLASYFAGLALGYWVGGLLAGRIRRPLLSYGGLEIGAGLWALAVPLILRSLQTPALARLIHYDDPNWQAAVRAAVCLLLLLPATTALGGTLPLMARWLEFGRGQSTPRVAWAYGLNTLGGLVGVLGTTWFLLSFVGVTASSYVAAGVSILCGLAAIAVSAVERFDPQNGPWGQRQRGLSPMPQDATASKRLVLLVGASGFATLALEVLYTRMFALVFHNSTYTFGLVVAVVLLGLAGGAWVAAYAVRRYPPLPVAGWASLLAGGAVAISTLIFLRQTGVDYFRGGDTFAAYMLASVGLVALIVLPPSLLLGTVLPLLWSAASRTDFSRREKSSGKREVSRRNLAPMPAGPSLARQACVGPAGPSLAGQACVSRVVGRLTAVNTLSAAAGALAASFLLLPLLGLWGSFMAVAMLSVATGAALLAMHARTTPVHSAAVIAVSALVLAAWQTTAARISIPPGKTVVYRSESAYGWIDVLRDDATGHLSLRENVHYTHGSTASAVWERRQAHIPLLLHPRPRDVLFLGAGTGATAGGAAMHQEAASITVVELIPEVIEAARLFERSNLGVLDDPRTRIHIDDARHYLLATDRKFDAIVSDLFVPWESKTGYLYTVGHYRVARGRLAPGGVFCQWLPMWQLGPREFEMIADSFAEVFPNTTVWLGNARYNRTILALVGTEQPLALDGEGIEARLRTISADGRLSDRFLREGEHLARLFVGHWQRTHRGPLNTDEHPRLEFAMPLTYADHHTLKRQPMRDYFHDVLSRLPQTGVAFSNVDEQWTAAAGRRRWQSVQLRK